MLSARAGEEARVEGLEAGADDYLVKPFSANELLARVSLQIERAQRRAEVERQRGALRELFEQAPACIALLRGPSQIFELANPLYLQLFGGRDILGKPIREALPELEGQPFFELLDQVRRTGVPYVGTESSVYMDATKTGRIEEHVFNFVYQPMRDVESGEVDSVARVRLRGHGRGPRAARASKR